MKYPEALDFGYTVLNSSHLYLFGKEDSLKESLRWVSFYSARTNKGLYGEPLSSSCGTNGSDH